MQSSTMDDKRALLGEATKSAGSRMGEINLKELFPELIGRSSQMYQLLEKVYKASCTDSPVLIYGDSGTGKELIASALHRLSLRAHKRFVPINCSAIPENLLESELFGYEKGAFTGASTRRAGHFEIASGGTIFLDEIGDMPANLQVKLLRVLQEKQFTPIGSTALHKADVRIIAATNVDLEEAVKNRKFRLDLYYRLNVLPIRLPALKDRGEDIELLLDHFMNQMNLRHQLANPCFLSPETLAILKAYNWPGNVRELQNLIERLVIMGGGGMIQANELPNEILAYHLNHSIERTYGVQSKPASVDDQGQVTQEEPKANSEFRLLPEEGIDLTAIVETLENNFIIQALERTQYNKNQAAKLLGINRTTLVERIKKRKLAPLNSPSREL